MQVANGGAEPARGPRLMATQLQACGGTQEQGQGFGSQSGLDLQDPTWMQVAMVARTSSHRWSRAM